MANFQVKHSRRNLKLLALALMFSTVVLALTAINADVPIVKAQATDGVYVYESCGGTVSAGGTNLTGGKTYNYTDGSTVAFTAKPLNGFNFLCWEYANTTGTATSTNNPFNYKIAAAECAIQPLFTPTVNASLASTTSQTGSSPFEVLISIGGTTSPGAAVYTNYSVGDIATFAAKAGSGFKFLYWLVPAASGGSAVSTANPLKFNVTAEACAVQAYFIPESSSITLPSYGPVTSPTPTSTTVAEFPLASAAIGALATVAVCTYVFNRKTKIAPE